MNVNLRIKNKADWGLAVVLSILLNAGIFSLTPSLITRQLDVKINAPQAVAVNMIRIRHEERPAEKKTTPKPRPLETPAEKRIIREIVQTPVPSKLKLPFEINATLPQVPGVVPTLLMEKYAPEAPEVHDIGDIDRPITVLAQTPPVYPIQARRMGITGRVDVRLLVSEEGRVEHVDIINSEPGGVFEESVKQSLLSWKFSPGTVSGTAVKTYVTTTIRFNLENE